MGEGFNLFFWKKLKMPPEVKKSNSFMKRRQLDIIQQNPTGSHQLLIFSGLPLLFKTILHLENPFITGFGTFEDINNRTHCEDEHQNTLVVELSHSPVN